MRTGVQVDVRATECQGSSSGGWALTPLVV